MSVMNILIRSGSRLTTPVVTTFTESAIGRRAAAVCLEIEISFRYPICSGRILHLALDAAAAAPPDVECDLLLCSAESF